MFRMNFMFVWLVLNICYFCMIIRLVVLASLNTQWNALTVYALSIAAIVLFKVACGVIYLAWWRIYKQFHPRFTQLINLQ